MTEPFVGRATERAVFRSALRGARDVPPVQYLHAMAGAGKSALLRQYGHDAARAGRTVVEVDGSRFATPKALSAAVGNIDGLPDPVLLVDDVDRCEGLEPWLRGCLLPSLSEDAIVVLAGRRAPEPAWTADPGWAGLARTYRLPPLEEYESVRLLDGLHVPRPAQAVLVAFAAGHPLALRVAAADASARPQPTAGTAGAWTPTRSTTSFLVGRLAGEVTTVSHRKALAVAAAAGVVTEGLLRAELGRQATSAFQWLRTRPYMTPVDGGLEMSAVLVNVMLADAARRRATHDDGNLRQE